ncbi:hypothetical protein Tco_1367005, partial [Tanacetum coccineum]
RSRSARKHQKNVLRKKGISKSHQSIRSEARNRSKSKSVKSKPQSVRASQRKSSSDSGYDTMSDSGSEDLSIPYRRPKTMPFTKGKEKVIGMLMDCPIVIDVMTKGLRVRMIYVDGGEVNYPLGVIDLEVTIGEYGRTRTVIMEFIVVKIPSPYNALLGYEGMKAKVKKSDQKQQETEKASDQVKT